MSLEIFTFDKTCRERLVEFRDILCGQKTRLLASCVFNEWKIYLQLLVEPRGWQAIWKISAARCKELLIDFPAVALVQVEDVDFESLCATVKIVAVQDDFNLPSVNKLPLQQLFPTRDQRENFLDVERIACALDQLRFFISNVWRPWDLEDGVYDWVGEHLEKRLQLHYDICKGVVFPKTGKKIRALIREGRELQLQIDSLNDEQELSMLDDSAFGDVSFVENTDCKGNAMEQLEARKQIVIAELAMLENPIQRSLIESRESNLSTQKRKRTGSAAPEACFVWLRGPAKELMAGLERTRTFIAEDTQLRCLECAQDALDESMAGDTIFLCSGQHKVLSAGGLATGGVLRGDSRSNTSVVGSPNGQTMFDFSPRSCKVSLSSLTLDMRGIQLGSLLQEGTMVLEDCDFVGSSSNFTQQGIVVMPGAFVVANNCHFTGFGTSINVHKNGKLEMKGCTISKSCVGIQVEAGGWISLSHTLISSCSSVGVKLITDSTMNQESCGKIDSIEILNRFPAFKIEAVSFDGNGNDVLLAEKQNPIEGLLEED